MAAERLRSVMLGSPQRLRSVMLGSAERLRSVMLGSAERARRVLQLWRLYATMDLLFLARGPVAAITYYVSDALTGVAAATATFLLAERFNGIGPWTRPQILFMLGYALLVRALIDLFFNYNLAFISRRIGRGQLDHVLIQPQPLWMALLTEGFAPITGSGMLLPGVGLLIWSGRDLHLSVSPAWWGMFAANVLASIAIVLAFEYIWGSLAFWAPRAAEEINSDSWRLLTQLAPFPLDGVAGLTLVSLVTVVPVGLVAWYPSRALLGIESPVWAAELVLTVAALSFAAFAAWVFTRGLRHYGHTGSTRYLAYGHRR